MKKILLLSFFFLSIMLLATVPASAATRTVTVNWTISDTTNVQGYKMYYYYNSDMTDEHFACETDDASATSLTCDINITSYPIYFSIAAITADEEVPSPLRPVEHALSTVRNFTVLTPSGNTPPNAVITTNTTTGNAPLTVNFDGSSSSDQEGTISTYAWNFGDGSLSTETSPSHTYTSVGSFTTTLTVTDEQGTSSSAQATINVTSTGSGFTNASINFQPADSPVPAGFEVDSGDAFTSTAGYGWINLLGPDSFFDQDSSISPDQAYDTMTNSTNANAYWELAVPESGSYHVTVCMGDPRNSYGTMQAQVEGQAIINDSLSSTQRWIERSLDVNITDGRLTLTFTGTDRVQVCWIKVEKN